VFEKQYSPLLCALWNEKQAYEGLRTHALGLLEEYDAETAVQQARAYLEHLDTEDLYHIQAIETAVLLLLRHKKNLAPNMFEQWHQHVASLPCEDAVLREDVLDVCHMGIRLMKKPAG
jgi:hypothetical protein